MTAISKESPPLTPEETKAVTWMAPVLAMPLRQAAQSIGVSYSTLRRLVAAGRIKRTDYGVIPVSEIERHLQEAIEAA
jgi:hypothetical protein